MSRYILRRVVMMVPLIFGISVIMFAVIRFAPGDPAELLADPEQLTTEQLEAVRANLGLDRPFHIQYVRMMTSLASGDLLSFRTRQPVLTMIAERLPTTLTLTVLGMTFGFTFGIAIGVVQALRPYSKLDDAGTFLSLFGFAVPNFWLGLMLIMIFAERLSWLPASGIRPGGASGWNPLEIWPYLILPTIVLGTSLMASLARYTRSAMLEALDQDFVRTARSKGLREYFVVTRHALRNAMLPAITLVGMFFPFLLGGAVVVEMVFALPGVGRLALDSVFIRDYPVVLTVNIMGALAVLIGSLLADIGYAMVDPRIRYD